MGKRCYNCGIELSKLKKREKNAEHIPAKCLFIGYPDEYKENRFTVDACKKCNDYYEKIDEDLRDFIGFVSEEEDKKQMSINSVKKVYHNKKNRSKILTFEKNGLNYFANISKLDELHKKNFMGLYSKIFKDFLSDEFKLTIFSDYYKYCADELYLVENQRKIDLGKVFFENLKSLPNWKYSGNKNIFSFKFAFFRNDCLLDADENEINPDDIIICSMLYNNILNVLVLAQK